MEMTSLEIAKYLSKESESNQAMVYFLEDILNIKIEVKSTERTTENIIAIPYTYKFYSYNNKELAETDIKDKTVIITQLWKLLDDKQKQTLIDTIKGMQSRDKPKANKTKKETTVINNNLTQNNTNTANSLSFATCQTIAELRNLIEKDDILSEQTKKEFSELFEKLNKEPSKLDLVKFLAKLVTNNILPSFMNEIITKLSTLL